MSKSTNRTTFVLFFILFTLPSFLGFIFVTRRHDKNNILCDATLWNHVYKSERLEVIEDCKTVTGVVSHITREDDGDYHIRLRLDSQFENLLNNKNIAEQHGDLVLEPICQTNTKYDDAVYSCGSFRGGVVILPIGTHVEVTGSYVLDKEHGWNEIHPVSLLRTK